MYVQRFFVLRVRDFITARASKMFAKAVLSQLFLISQHLRVGAQMANRMRSAIMCLLVFVAREEFHKIAAAA